tara:strand:+ start:465 stop:632 length:168 start_codon:yes stop_codon:yes gene_type:complete
MKVLFLQNSHQVSVEGLTAWVCTLHPETGLAGRKRLSVKDKITESDAPCKVRHII